MARTSIRRKEPTARWLLLFHQIPPTPSYLRVKIVRQLYRLGAVALKNSVYALPAGPEFMESFHWIARELASRGGEATVCEARFVEGLSDSQVKAIFHAARDADYAQIAEEAREVVRAERDEPDDGDSGRADAAARAARLRKRITEVADIDFFDAPGRSAAESSVAALEAELKGTPQASASAGVTLDGRDYKRRRWVTRAGIFVDRMASAWLIRRCIDKEAEFVFVSTRDHRPRAGEIRFDMFNAEFTHEGDRCTFEVLSERFAIHRPAIRALGEIVHDIDLKDRKFGRDETRGIERLLAGIAMNHRDDSARLERACAVFDDLSAGLERGKALRKLQDT